MSEPAPAPRPARWKGPAAFAAFVVGVLGAASVVAGRHRALHGADFVTGLHLDVTFAPPAHLRAVAPRAATHAVAWPLTQGSGSLAVRLSTAAWPSRERHVTAVRVAPGADLLDGVEATVRVTGYDTVTVGADGAAAPIGHVTLECVERAADGVRTHRIELRGDGSWVDPDRGLQ